MKKLFIILAVLAVSGAAHGQISNPPRYIIGTTVVSGLPPAASATGQFWAVTDGASASDCGTGGGSTGVVCYSNGVSWASTGGGGTGTVTGQASGVLPLATAASVIGAQSHIDDGVTKSGTATVSVPLNLPTSISSAQPLLDIRHPSFAGGANCDGTNTHDIGPALQAAWNALPVGGGKILIPGSPTACYWANPTPYDALNNPTGFQYGSHTGPITLEIQGQLRGGTTFAPPSIQLVLKCIGGAGNAQFQMAGESCSIWVRPATNTPITGTLGTAITPTYTGTGNPTASLPVVCNSSVTGNIYQDTNSTAAVLWTCASTTGSITSGTNSLTVTASGGFKVGDNISVAGAGAAGGALNTKITAVNYGTNTFTLLANAATTAGPTAAVTVNFTAESYTPVNNWVPGALVTITPSSMAGIFPGTVLSVAETTSCTPSTLARTSNLVTATYSGSCHIPAGVPITVAGVSDSTFNGTHASTTNGPFLMTKSSYFYNTNGWTQGAAANATCNACGGTVVGLNEDTVEDYGVIVYSTTASTLTTVFFRPHASTAQFGGVGVYWGSNSQSSQISDMSFIADGTAFVWFSYRASLDRVGTTQTGACGGNLASFGMTLNDNSYSTMRDSSIGAYCQPWAIHLSRKWNYTVATNGPLYAVGDVTVGGYKLDHGAQGLELIGNHSFCEQCARGVIQYDPTAYWSGVPQFLRVDNIQAQDNPNGFETTYINELTPTAGNGLPRAEIRNVFGSTTTLINDGFYGNLRTDTAGPFSLVIPRGIVGTFDDGNLVAGEIRPSGSSFAPSLVPFPTANLTTDPASWTGGSCTVNSGDIAPDGTATAGEVTGGAGGNTFSVGTYTTTPLLGDWIWFGGWVKTTTKNKQAASGAGGGAFVLNNNNNANFQMAWPSGLSNFNNGTTVQVGSGPYDSGIVDDAWHPVISLAKVTVTNNLSSTLNIVLGCDQTKTMHYWSPFVMYGKGVSFTATSDGSTGVLTAVSSTAGLTPGMAISGTGIPANSHINIVNTGASTVTIDQNTTSGATSTMIANITLEEASRIRAELLHGSVPANMPSGGGIVALNPAHKLYWGSDTNIYRGAAGVAKTDGIVNAVGGFQHNGAGLKTTDLSDWTNAGSNASTTYAKCTAVDGGGNCTAWGPGTPVGTGTVINTGTSTTGNLVCEADATGTNIQDCGIPGTNISRYVAKVDSPGLTGNVGTATAYAVPASKGGYYRVSCYEVITVAGTTSTLPQCLLNWTDADTGGAGHSSVGGTLQLGPSSTTHNTVGDTNLQNNIVAIGALIHVAQSTNIQYSTTSYASTGTAMTYALHLVVEYMGP